MNRGNFYNFCIRHRLKWKFNAHGNVGSSPAVSGGSVFALSLDGHLYAIDATTGAPKWSFATQGERRHTARGIDYAAPAAEVMPDPWDFFLSSPAGIVGVGGITRKDPAAAFPS